MNYTIEYQDYPSANRNHKDTVFRISFKKKEDLLHLYNAINGTSYQKPDELEITTLENALYLSMKNDTSFLLDCTINLYEHQSSFNPNMPLRGVLYFARLYEKYIANRNINIFSSTLQKLPTPRYIVFYNGAKEAPDKMTLRLSDSFEAGNGCLECEVTMYNINYGRNRELMEKCRRLEEYAIFVDCIRFYLTQKDNNLDIAINEAINECIDRNILEDVLMTQRAEVLQMLLTTFNKELYEQGLKEDAYSEGVREGEQNGITKGRNEKLMEQIRKKLAKGKTIGAIADELEETVETIQKMVEACTKNE